MNIEPSEADEEDPEQKIFLKSLANNKFCSLNHLKNKIECQTTPHKLASLVNLQVSGGSSLVINRHLFTVTQAEDDIQTLKVGGGAHQYPCHRHVCSRELRCPNTAKNKATVGKNVYTLPTYQFMFENIPIDGSTENVPKKCLRSQNKHCYRLRFGPRIQESLSDRDCEKDVVSEETCSAKQGGPYAFQKIRKRIAASTGLLPKEKDICKYDMEANAVVCKHHSNHSSVPYHKSIRLNDPSTAFVPHEAVCVDADPQKAEVCTKYEIRPVQIFDGDETN